MFNSRCRWRSSRHEVLLKRRCKTLRSAPELRAERSITNIRTSWACSVLLLHAFLDTITTPEIVRILSIDAPAVGGWDEWRQFDAQSSEVHLKEALQQVGAEGTLVSVLP